MHTGGLIFAGAPMEGNDLSHEFLEVDGKCTWKIGKNGTWYPVLFYDLTFIAWRLTLELTYPPNKAYLKLIFLFPRWDMLIPWRVGVFIWGFVANAREIVVFYQVKKVGCTGTFCNNDGFSEHILR